MSKPTQSIFPIENGKLTTVLDCNNLQLINLDESNLSGGGGSGNDTGTTTAILKGDGNHGFADAVAGTDYATVGSVMLKEDQTAHDTDVNTLTASIATNTASIATLTTSVAAKADDAATTAALALKADDTDFQVYITSNNSAVAGLVTDVANVTTALGNKADSASTSAALAGKEPTLPTTANDRYILARRNSAGTDAWYFVDPITLGTTSQSFTDGVENSSTTLTSATANFVAGDVGKTITGDNIPAATTIASRTNSTTIILSAAATATGSGNNFTILNRLEVGGTGTVTSVAVTNNATALISAAVTNPTTSATLTLGIANATGANTFYGNFTAFAGPAGFGSGSAARNSLGGTTAGQALFQLANPTAISFPQITALNGAVTRTPAQVLSDIGGESALTFSTPLTRSTNVIGIQVATTLQSGYLSNSDWTTFNGKVAGTRTITTTAPLTGGGNLNTDRTLAIPAATALVDGYLTQGDFSTFTAKPPNTRTISTTAPLTGGGDLSANRTLGIPKATTAVDGYLAASDFSVFLNGTVSSVNAGTGGALVISTSAVPPVTRVMLNSVLTSTLQVTLPPSLNYPFSLGFPFIEFVDIAGGTGGSATANFGITLNRSSTDLVDGASSVTLPRGVGYLRVNSNGFNRWTTTKYYVDSFKDGTTPTKTVTLDISQQTAGTPGSLTLANGASVTVHPTDLVSQPGVISDISSTGIATKSQIKPTDLLPQEFIIGTAGVSISAGSVAIVTDNGTIDTIRIAGSLSGTLEIQWPEAVNYNSGEAVVLVDASGSVGLTNHATIVSNFGDTFNGNNSFIFDEANGRKVLTSNGLNGWSVSLVKTSIQPFQSITSLASFLFVTLDSNAVKQNAHLILGNSQNHLILNGVNDGMEFEFMLVQPSSGAAATLTLPNTSYVAGAAGVISLTGTNGAIDRLRGIFDGKANAYFWEAVTANYATAALPTAPSALTVGTITSTSIALSWTDNASNESGFVVERADGLSATIGFAALSPAPGANVTTFSDTGVTSGNPYTYRVKAVNSAGSSAYSAPANATASAGGPTADLWEVHFNEGGSNLTANATIPVGGTVDLTYADWTAVTQASAFAFNPSAGMLATTGTTITPTGGVAAGVTWTYRVVAFKNNGLHNIGPLTSTTVGYAVINNTGIFNRIQWTAVTGADFYNVYRTKAGTTPSTVGLIATNIPQSTILLDDTALPSLGVVPANIANATDQHAATAHSAITFATNKISLSFWIKGALSTTGTNNIISTTLGTSSFKVSYINGAKFAVNVPGTSGSVNFTVPNTAIANGAWHHVAMTIDNSTSLATAADFKVYYDGSSSAQTTTVGTNTKSGALNFPTCSPVVGDNPSVFAIDDVRIYGRILTTVETGALFTGNAQ